MALESLRRCGAIVLGLILTLARSGAGEEPRTVAHFEVEDPGWVRVPVEGIGLERLRSSYVVLDPEGVGIPFRVAPEEVSDERRRAEIVEIDQERAGWHVVLDLGPDPPLHDRLVFDFRRLGPVREVSLAGSVDAERWETLPVSDQFRLGEGVGESRAALAHAETTYRYLRLWWPRAGGFPEIAEVHALAVGHHEGAEASRLGACHSAPIRGQVCELDLDVPGSVPRAVVVEIEGEGVVGYRVRSPLKGRWRTVQEGVWAPDAGVERRLSLAPGVGAIDRLRLELHGMGEAAVRLRRYRVLVARTVIELEAARAGVHRLVAGTVAEGNAPLPVRPPDVAVSRLVLEPLRPTWEVGPLADPGEGAPIARGRFGSSWEVDGDGIAPGSLAALGLPGTVYQRSRADLRDLRLANRGRQVPYVLVEHRDPALVIGRRDLAPTSRPGQGTSVVELDLPSVDLPLTSLRLVGASRPFRRGVVVRYGVDGPPAAPRTEWLCRPVPPLPCTLDIPLRAAAGSRLLLELEDGDNPPLEAIGVEVWRHRDTLVFFWPESGGVDLLAGADQLAPPEYDLEAWRPELLVASPRPVELRVDGGDQHLHGLTTAAILVLVLAGAAGILVVLGRLLRMGSVDM